MAAHTRTILHLDLDAFYCAIEEQRDGSLRGKAFAVGGQPNERGVVASCSYAARRMGVRSAMPMSRALALCPHLTIVPTRHADYRAASHQVMARLHELTPLVEQISIDEAFLDVTALVRPVQQGQRGEAIARRLQTRIREELELPCSLGVASNKMVAKIATDYGKARITTGRSPNAIWVVPAGHEAAFLAPLPATALWGVGPKTASHLASLGLHTIGDIAGRPLEDLRRHFGRHGYEMWLHAQGIDKREIVTERETKSISTETTFVHDVQDVDQLEEILTEQAASVAAQLQRQRLQGTTVKLKLRWTDFTTPTRQETLPYPTDQEHTITATAIKLLHQLQQDGRAVRLLGVGVSGLSAVQQLSLWAPEAEPGEAEPDKEDHLIAGDKHEGNTGSPADNAQALQEKQQRILEAIALLQARFGKNMVSLGARGR